MFSAFRFYDFLRCNRPGFFSGLVLVNFLLYLKRFHDIQHLVCQLGSFLFLCGFPRLRPCADVVFTLVVSVAVDTSSIMDVYLYLSWSSQS